MGTLIAVGIIAFLLGSASASSSKSSSGDNMSKNTETLELEEKQLSDEEIKKCFYNMLTCAKREIFIVSPWVSERVTEQILPILKSATNRGVRIHIVYGIYSYKSEDTRSETSKQQIKRYQKELGNFLTVEESNTHVKVCICDDYYLVGSYNFLSYDGNYDTTSNAWHELCSYGKSLKKVRELKQKCLSAY